MKKYCSNCNSTPDPKFSFCPDCGKKLEEVLSPTKVNTKNNISPEEEDELIIRIICPNCEVQNMFELEPNQSNYHLTCFKCNNNYRTRIAKVRSKRSKKSKDNADHECREFNIRIIELNGSEDLIRFMNYNDEDIDLKAKDWVVVSYDKKNKLRIVQNSTISQYLKIDDGNFVKGCMGIVNGIGALIIFGIGYVIFSIIGC